MEYLIFPVQIIGVLIPLVGIISLLRRKHQSSNSMYLMVTNMGCLLMNSAYQVILSADTTEQAMAASKLAFLGSVLFYYFFILFLVSYLWKQYPKWPFTIWAVLEFCGVLIFWDDTLRNWIFEKQAFLAIERNSLLGVFEIHIEQNVMYLVRYSWICILLACLLIYSNIKLFRIKDRTGRNNLTRLIGAQLVIVLSLIGYLCIKPAFSLEPLFASLSILFIILGVIADEFYGIREMGREWVFEQIKDAFIIVDKKYGYLDANSYALSIFNELRRLEKQIRIPENIYQMFMSEEQILQIDGKYYEKKIVDIEDKNKVVGYSMLLLDVTEQQELMEKVQEEKERADAANQAKSAFVSNVSHEIRTPMNAIVGMTQILLKKELPRQERDYIVNIQNSGNALLTIINDILDMSKIESGKMELVEEGYSFVEMLNDLGMIILNRIGSKPVELIFDIDPELPGKLYGDALRIRQIIINLMNNATKFTEQGYVALCIRVEKAEGEDIELAISVKDSGQGIREEDLSKLFGSFQQVDQKKNHKKEGTGLGLSISKQLVELMDGSIGVRSEYGKGSEFYFNIHQKLVGDKKAVELKNEAEQMFVSGTMKNEAAYQTLQKLADYYHLIFVSDIFTDLMENGKLYYFTDCYDRLSEEEKKRLEDCKAVVYSLQNPMMESEVPEGTKAINKPLYTYNFCHAIGAEEETEESFEEKSKENTDSLAFTAPEARILVVDDNEINRMVVQEMLEMLQVQIDMAENGAEAVEKVQKTQYDIVLMDHIMPVMDGVEAVKAIRELPDDSYQKLPVIALTANDMKEQRDGYLQAGMSDFLAKPIMMEDLYNIILKWVPREKINI